MASKDTGGGRRPFERVFLPFLLVLVLLAAWAVRWDQGPVFTTTGGVQGVYYRDRWTNQDWTKWYADPAFFYPQLPAGLSFGESMSAAKEAGTIRDCLTGAWAVAFALSTLTALHRLRTLSKAMEQRAGEQPPVTS